MDGGRVPGGANYPVSGDIGTLSMLLEGGFLQWVEKMGFREGYERVDLSSRWGIEDAGIDVSGRKYPVGGGSGIRRWCGCVWRLIESTV